MPSDLNPASDPAARVMEWADLLARHSDAEQGLTCLFMSSAHRAVAEQLAAWMREAGFDDVRHDDIGNVVARYRADPAYPQPGLVCTGSHYDTVNNGGRYDGRLGILLPIAMVAALHEQGRRLPYDLEVVAFAEEEGVRFGGTFLGSSAYAGRFDQGVLDVRDAEGVTMREAIRAAGLQPEAIGAAAADVSRIRHYFEVHIEQGPVLLDRGLAVGVVSSIAGSVRRLFTLTGQAGHAGTTPMGLRRDAACAAAEIILYVEERCSREPGLVGTVGRLEVPRGSVNVIPGACQFSLDVRAPDDAQRDAAVADIMQAIEDICARRKVRVAHEETMRAAAAPCAPAERGLWAEAIAALSLPVLELPSGAGHDAMMMAKVTPMSMLFVRCGNGGISHNPLEIVALEDVQVAAGVLAGFLDRLAGA
jgi:hydantoinase/carbamoylase family amidase